MSSTRPGVLERQRRGSRRRALHEEVEVLQPASGRGVTINESEGGIRIAVDCPVRVHDLCTLRISDADGDSRLETGRVIWSREYRDGWIAGLEWVDFH